MSSSHLKRFAAPKNWVIERKICRHVLKPNAGAHALKESMALGLLFKQLGLANTTREVKKIVLNSKVFVNGKRVKDYRFGIGLLDVISIPEANIKRRVALDAKTHLGTVPVAHADEKQILAKVVGKRMHGKDQMQVHCSGGRNILTGKNDYALGDTLVLEMPEQKIASHLPLKNGAHVYLVAGKHAGTLGVVDDIKGPKVWFRTGNVTYETNKTHVFVIPETFVKELTVKP